MDLTPAAVSPDLLALPDPKGIRFPALFNLYPPTARRVIEFFAAHIRNPNTRKVYAKAAGALASWCERRGNTALGQIQPLHVAAYIEELQTSLAPPSVKQHLAAIRMLFDWLVVGQAIATNPASAVRGPKYSVKRARRRS